MVQLFAVVFQYARSCAVTVKVTFALAPGCRSTRWKPLSCLAGSPVDAGSPTYSWAISAPALLPVLVTVALTVALPLPSSAPTCSPEKPKVVYDRPYPNGKSGAMFCASYHR